MKAHLLVLFTGLITTGCISIICPQRILAQAEANIWYFGENAGVDFSQGKPIALTDGMLNTIEGCATICDQQGKLLFYTDGITIWNKNHEVMRNGEDLLGDVSATQSGVIVPKPNNPTIFYVFTVDHSGGENGVRYNLVDLQAENGLGRVIEKNKPLLAPTDEKITAVRHKNNRDIWIITHKWNSQEYYAYLLTEEGLQTTPIITKIGEMHGDNPDQAIGYLKASPDGKKLAAAVKGLHIFELFDFDNQTGKLSNYIKIPIEGDARPYGIEFSSDGTKMYGTAGQIQTLFQFDLSQPTAEAIQASRYKVAELSGWAGALQLGNDGKIYVSVYGSNFLEAIQKPNQKGKDCQFEPQAVDLKGRRATLGLPTFVQTYFEDMENISKISSQSNTKIKLNEPFVKNILFDFDKFDIKPQYFSELDELVEYLKIAQYVKIDISGHTDSDGNEQKNLLLSQNRAQAVANYLIQKGINKERITYQGFGESKPIAPNDTPENKAKNRRIEFVLIK
ncbi:MAG: OmpA family protein [Microscillaceae bacterium]|nr:OmpA family protein [Microscillaceae bacterium]MDW8460102.1 OmpA family protein [Cytophagales bacterium]